MTMRYLKSAILVLLGIVFASAAFAVDKKDNALSFDIVLIPQASRHVQWLAYPSYLAVALENNSLSLDISSNLAIRDGKSLKFDKYLVNYLGERGNTYFYTVDVYLPIGGKFDIPVEIDASAVNAGKLTINVKMPLSEYIPLNYKERVAQRLNRITDVAIQRKLADYLDGFDAKPGFSKKMESKIELLMIDSYNRRIINSNRPSGKDPMRAEPISESILLIGSLLTLLVMIIFGIATLFRRNTS